MTLLEKTAEDGSGEAPTRSIGYDLKLKRHGLMENDLIVFSGTANRKLSESVAQSLEK
jgi:hypothetical protein